MLRILAGPCVFVLACLLDFSAASSRQLVDLYAPEQERGKLLAQAASLERITLSDEEMQWLHVLADGWASPLDGFMTEDQYLQSLHYENLIVNDEFIPMPVPIVKACSAEDRDRITGKELVALSDQKGNIIATLEKPKVFQHRKEERAARTFGTTHPDLPYISMINAAEDFLVSGRVTVLKEFMYNDGMDSFRLSPRSLKEKFEKLGADAIFVFQLRNPVHNGHALLMQDTAKRLREQGYKKPVLWLSPLGGWTKDDDVPLDVRMAQHKAIIKNKVFGDTPVVCAIFPSPMLYAGPREVQWHAAARLNGGATHYIVGRDPAGMKHPGTDEDMYDAWHGQRMLQMNLGLRKLQLLPFTFASYDIKNKRMAFFDPARKNEFLSISGTKMRQLARDGEEPPEGFMDKEGWSILVRFYKGMAIQQDEL